MNNCRIYSASKWLCFLSILLLVGCAQTTDEMAANQSQRATVPPALGNVELHTHELANELFMGVRQNRQSRYAVVGFVPVTSMEYDRAAQGPLMLLGHQLEQGLMTESARRGLITQDFKVSNDILISDDADRVLTRNIEQLSGVEVVDFYITGTIVEQQEGAIVNARIINARSKDVVAAATRFFPAALFWQREQVTTRAGKIYRTADAL
ncbi:hypothetical protein KIU71_13505 [Alteromonas sp. SM 2104]|nr:hypothetical protein [Alteromonas oceanisediminis]